MAMKLSLGQYYAADSPIHRMDPRAKTVCALVIIITVFFIHTAPQLALGFAFVIALAIMARVPAAKLLDAVRPIAFVLLLLGLFNLFVTTTGEVVLLAGPLRITTDGLRAALIYSLRLIIGVITGVLILLTTTPSRLTDAFDSMLSPLSRIGLPGHELAMVFSLMLRFIPTLADETSAITDAQKARGGALGEGSPVKRIRAIAPILVSLLASSLNHANDLSRALDARCYVGGASRSHWHPLRMRRVDWLFILVAAAYATALILAGL